MKNKKLITIIIFLCIIASIVMYRYSNHGHFTELKNFWYIPLPLAALLIVGLFSSNKK
jgi:hypothetical protein